MLGFNVVVFVLLKLDPFREYFTDIVIFCIWVIAVGLLAKVSKGHPTSAIHQKFFTSWVHWIS